MLLHDAVADVQEFIEVPCPVNMDKFVPCFEVRSRVLGTVWRLALLSRDLRQVRWTSPHLSEVRTRLDWGTLNVIAPRELSLFLYDNLVLSHEHSEGSAFVDLGVGDPGTSADAAKRDSE